MAFECVHCGAVIEDDALKLPRSGAMCPSCKKDPTEGWSPYPEDTTEAARKLADDIYLRLMTQQDWGLVEATLFFLEDIILETRHELSFRLGRKPGIEQKCSVCAAVIAPDEGFRIEMHDQWRSSQIIIALCEKHLSEGLYGRELDLHANHPNPWITRGDWHYANKGREVRPVPPEWYGAPSSAEPTDADTPGA